MQRIQDDGRLAAEQVHELLRDSRVGQRWERILRSHLHEIDTHLAITPGLQDDAIVALGLLSRAPRVDDETVQAFSKVLDVLMRLGSIGLQRDVVRLRDELSLARGLTLDELLTS
jgi:hypothetical protein